MLYDGNGQTLQRPRPIAAAFNGSGTGNRSKFWETSSSDINSLVYSDVNLLRERCRDAVRKNPYAEKAISSFVASAIGVGIKLQSQHPDEGIRKQINREFLKWTDYADADGILDFFGLQRLACRSMREGGECFARFRYRRPEDGFRIPLQIQLLEAEHLPTWKPTTSEAVGNNTIDLGIEFNLFGKRVAYHLYKRHPGAVYSPGGANYETTRVPAEQVMHLFDPLRPGQKRGIPWFTPILTDLWELGQYSDAQLVKQKVAAMFVGWVKTLNDDMNTGGMFNAEQSETSGVGLADLEPGTAQILQPNEEMGWNDPPDAGSFGEFMRTCLRGIAAGLGITYEMLTGDLSTVNFSSSRVGQLDFRRVCEQFQHSVFVQQFCRPLFNEWLRIGVLSGALNLPGYADDPQQYQEVRWITPGFPWINPLQDVKAAIAEVRAGFTTRSAVVSAKGDDVDQIDAENAADNARADAEKLSYDSDGRRPETLQSTNATQALIEEQIREDEQQMQRSALIQ